MTSPATANRPATATETVLAPLTDHPVIVHAGFDNTAQTTLQQHFLIRHPGVLCLGKPRSEEFTRELRRGDIFFDESRVRALFGSLIAGDTTDKVWVLADDNFSNFPPVTGVNAKRLRALFPNARVMFTIRNQIDLITSWYAQGGRVVRAPRPYRGRHASFDGFLEHEAGNWEESMLSVLDFDLVVGFYEELFGAGNVRVFAFENFIADKRAYLQDICDFLGVDPAPAAESFVAGHSNPRPSGRQQHYVAFRNHFLPGVPLRRLIPGGEALQRWFAGVLGRGRPVRVVMPEPWRARLAEKYAPGNRRLSERHGLALQRLGYPT